MADDDTSTNNARPENIPAGPVGDAIYNAAQKWGMDPRVLGGIASIESSFQPTSNVNKPTQYKGLFQIGHNEWSQYGGNGNIYNAADNADAAAHMLSDHANWFNQTYGRDASPAELYMMHQQGRGFFSNGAMTNIGGNPYPGMSGAQDHNSFLNGWGRELARRMNTEFSGEQPYVGSGGKAGGGAPLGAGGVSSDGAAATGPSDDEIERMLALIPTKKSEEELQPHPPLKALPPLNPLASRLRNIIGGAPRSTLPPVVAQRLTEILGRSSS